MQFSTVALFSVVALASAQSTTVVSVADSTTVSTIYECESTVTDCPYSSTTVVNATSSTVSSSNGSNVTVPSVTTFEGAANGIYVQAGAAVAAGLVAMLL